VERTTSPVSEIGPYHRIGFPSDRFLDAAVTTVESLIAALAKQNGLTQGRIGPTTVLVYMEYACPWTDVIIVPRQSRRPSAEICSTALPLDSDVLAICDEKSEMIRTHQSSSRTVRF